jgi:hypothetical protein
LPPKVGWGKWKFGGIFNIGKNISILAKVTQVSDVAHGPLVLFFLLFFVFGLFLCFAIYI